MPLPIGIFPLRPDPVAVLELAGEPPRIPQADAETAQLPSTVAHGEIPGVAQRKTLDEQCRRKVVYHEACCAR